MMLKFPDSLNLFFPGHLAKFPDFAPTLKEKETNFYDFFLISWHSDSSCCRLWGGSFKYKWKVGAESPICLYYYSTGPYQIDKICSCIAVALRFLLIDFFTLFHHFSLNLRTLYIVWSLVRRRVTRHLTRLQTMCNVLKYRKILYNVALRLRCVCVYFFNLLNTSTVKSCKNKSAKQQEHESRKNRKRNNDSADVLE